MDDFRAVLQQTVDAFVDNNTEAVRTKDTSLLSAVLTEDCVRLYRPLSFVRRYPQFFKSEITNADYEAQMMVELQTIRDVSQKVTRTVIDTTQRRATVWTEKIIWTYGGSKRVVEMIWDLNFTEDGTRVSQILEFVDSYESTRMVEDILRKLAATHCDSR